MNLSNCAIRFLVTTRVNVDPQFNRLTWEINDINNFDSVKQIDGENNKVILIATKGTIAMIITTTVNKVMMLISLWVTVV